MFKTSLLNVPLVLCAIVVNILAREHRLTADKLETYEMSGPETFDMTSDRRYNNGNRMSMGNMDMSMGSGNMDMSMRGMNQWMKQIMNNINQQQSMFGMNDPWKGGGFTGNGFGTPASLGFNRNWAQQWQSLMGNANTHTWKPWWQGENVCKREEKTGTDVIDDEEDKQQKDSNQQNSDFMNHFTSSSCQDSGDTYVCTLTMAKNGAVKQLKTVYQCCHGWTRDPMTQDGCTIEENLEPTLETLERENLTRFADVIESVNLVNTINEGNRTVFAPINQALLSLQETDDLSPVLLDGTDEKSFVRDIVLAHLVDGWSTHHDWKDEQILQTLNPEATIRINIFNNGIRTANCAPLTSSGTKSSNAIIHQVDRLMMPAKQTIWEIIGQDPRFSTLAGLVDDNLRELLLDKDAHYTLLAFTNDGFDALDSTVKDYILQKDDCMQDYVRQLLINTTMCSAAIRQQGRVTNVMRNVINATRDLNSDKLSFNNVPVRSVDRMATNGVIHIMQSPILFDKLLPISQVASRLNGGLDSELLFNTEWNNVKEEITVFLPPAGTLMAAELSHPDDFEDLLKNHVVPNEFRISPYNRNVVVKTLAEQELQVSVDSNPVTYLMTNRIASRVGCAKITKANVETCNGIIHMIDRPLSVPRDSLLALLEANSEYSHFVNYIREAGLADVLDSQDFAGTVLALENAVIDERLTEKQQQQLNDDPAALKTFVEKHLLRDVVCCDSFGNDGMLPGHMFATGARHRTLGGDWIFSTSPDGESRFVGNAELDNCEDLVATNGLLHKVSKPVTVAKRVTLADLLGSMSDRDDTDDDDDDDDYGWWF